MKQMNKIVLTLVLCASTQAFGFNIKFDPSTVYGRKLEIFIYESENDYKGMLTQVDILNLLRGVTLKVAPLVGKAAGTAFLVVPEPDFKAIALSIMVTSSLLEKVAKSGMFAGLVGSATKKGYTVDYIKPFTVGISTPRKCLSAASLQNHLWHDIKINKRLYFVIRDVTANQIIYADWAQNAWGDYTFSIGTLKDEIGGASLEVGNMVQTSAQNDAGMYCR